MRKIKEKNIPQIFIIYLRYLLGGTLVFSSIIKIKGKRFTTDSGVNHAIDSAWHFFETMYQSGLYWRFIGVFQLIAGFLLLTQRYSKLGALISLPITTNIFIITISYYFAFTPIITGLMLLANLFLIIWDWDTLKIIFNRSINQVSINYLKLEENKLWQYVGLLIFLFTASYRMFFDSYNMFLWLLICFLIGIGGLIFNWLKKN